MATPERKGASEGSGSPTLGAERQLAGLRTFAGRVAGCVDMDAHLDALLAEFVHLLEPADRGALLLSKPDSDQLSVHCTYGCDAGSLRDVSPQATESIADEAFRSGQARLYASADEVASTLDGIAAENGGRLESAVSGLEVPRSAICAPMVCGESKLGVLVAEIWRSDPHFDPGALGLAELLAGIAAVGMRRAQLEQETRHLRTALEQSQGLQGYIVSALSHELRTPLASIKGYTTALLLEDVLWDAATQREYLNVIVEESDRLSEITSDLLESAIIDAGLLQLERQPTRLAKLAQAVADDVSRRTDKHQFLLSFAADLPILDVDPSRIRRLLFNLMDNAVKYSPDGGLIVVRGQVSGDECLVSVADQGVGIAPQHLNRLFERFFRVKTVAGKYVAGSGLGLPIARSIVEAHGGRIWAESKLGQGSSFYVALPLGGLSSTAGVNGEGQVRSD